MDETVDRSALLACTVSAKIYFSAMLAAHPKAKLEYWFFKVNAGPVAILVDWIARRQTGNNSLRLSIHAPGRREVIFSERSVPMTADCTLEAGHTIGHLKDVSWDLSMEVGSPWIKPDLFPIGLLRMTDMALVSAPDVTFRGWIECDSVRYPVNEAHGMISHYWGRQLPQQWWWISANQFDAPDLSVECSFFTTSLWNSPLHTKLAYVYLREGAERRLIIPPTSSLTGTPDRFEIRVPRIGKKPITLVGQGREYGDLGEGIINTLVGDLTIRIGDRVVGSAHGTAGLERRAPVK